MDAKTKKARADRPADERKPADEPNEKPPAGYVYVTRSAPNAATPDDEDRPAGYVHIPGQDERRLVDVKSVPELELLGYRVVD